MANLHIRNSGAQKSRASYLGNVRRPVDMFFWLSNRFIISLATVLALRLRAEVIGGVSTSTIVIGALCLDGAPSRPTVAEFSALVEQ